MCEGEGKTIFSGSEKCVNQLATKIETTVEEVIAGSKIAEEGVNKERGMYYAVAVLPDTEINKIQNSIQKLFEEEKYSVPKLSSDKISLNDVRIIVAEGKAILGDDSTPAQARAIALNNARRKALEEAVGVDLHASSLLYNSELISDLVVTATRGLIIKQTVLEDKCYSEAEKIYCVAKIEAHVKPLSIEKDKQFNILSASVHRPDQEATVSTTVFQNNDEIQIRVTASEPSFINIFSVDQYGKVFKLYPNDYLKPAVVPAGKEFIFPDNNLRARGLKLTVTTPKGLNQGIESVLIISTKEEGHLLSDTSIQNPTISDLMRELSELNQSSWAEKTVGYEVVK